MASNDVCEMRLVMAAALTARRKTSNSFQGSNTKRVHALAILSQQADRYDQPTGTGELGAVGHENRCAARFGRPVIPPTGWWVLSHGLCFVHVVGGLGIWGSAG